MSDRTNKTSFHAILESLPKPKKVVITAGMPYANGPIHLGHLAGAFVPADIYARWYRIILGYHHVLFVSGTDDHGVNSLVRARKEGVPLQDFIKKINSQHQETLKKYAISLNHYGATSDPNYLKEHTNTCQTVIQNTYDQGYLSVKSSQQWYDPKEQVFIPDRLVIGQCPKCGYQQAHSQECDHCGAEYSPEQLIAPKSTLSSATPILKDTRHLWLNMYPLGPTLYHFFTQVARSFMQKSVLKVISSDIAPILSFIRDQGNPNQIKDDDLLSKLPRHKKRFEKILPAESVGQEKDQEAGREKVYLQFFSYDDLTQAKTILSDTHITTQDECSWAHRAITRDTTWGLTLPENLGLTDAELKQKTLYVWPESLIAPISFTKQALQKHPDSHQNQNSDQYWLSQEAERHQFIGIDNIYFYTVMQGDFWLNQKQGLSTSHHQNNTWPFSRIHTFFHLQVGGEKMSKSRGNYHTGDDILHHHPYSTDEIRYFLAFLSLREKPCDFDFKLLKERTDFLSGPLNAALEKPLSAAHKKFNSKVPDGVLLPKVVQATEKILKAYVKFMPQAKYPQFLIAVENYGRLINSLFATYKPHDDRFPERERADALFSSFFILKNLLIFLAPFTPHAMERLRCCLNLPKTVYCRSEIATAMQPGHQIAALDSRFFSLPEQSRCDE
ncbi:MAG: class I tRNA ligase family protein [Proteobacteria bacterium]|nr:class I tRNA ligase family protein [Pseudomonadota bacterium]